MNSTTGNGSSDDRDTHQSTHMGLMDATSSGSSRMTSSSSLPTSSDATLVCEEVSVAVTGKKTAIRGKVWRARNGDYVRYLCVDDGADYRPGGN